jgi:transcriptional antiterminator RfaH
MSRETENQSGATDLKKWYVVRSNNKQEKLCRLSLRDEGVEVYLPMLAKKGPKGQFYGAPLFPNFLFVHMHPVGDKWRAVFSARYVNQILGVGGRPSFIADRVIADIQAREREGFVWLTAPEDAPRCRFKPGDPVQLRKGPFALIDAVFLEPVDSKRGLILIRLLGESPRIAKADLAQLESSAATETPVPHLVSA